MDGIAVLMTPSCCGKNLGQLWLAYTELQGEFYRLQFISVDSYKALLPDQMSERIKGNYQLKLPYILIQFVVQ